ncbi:MAG: translocation/assembly module TamB, partial [bacterium]|nr:translocation/assembly module TamB [bacterium]
MTDAPEHPEPLTPVEATVETVVETVVEGVKRVGGPGWLMISAVVLVTIVALFFGGLRYVPITPPGRMFLEARASGLKLGSIGRLRIEGLTGDIWKDFSVRRLTIIDEQGVWLEAHDVRVVWRPTELIGRRFHADRVDARDVTLLRRPTFAPKGKSSAAPVSVDLDAFTLRLITRPAFSGSAGDFDVSGDFEMARLGGKIGKVAVASRLHPGDHLTLDFDLGRNDTIRLNADAVEADGGAIAGALGLPADRSFDLKAKATGTMSQGAFEIVARTGNQTPLDAKGAWTPEGGSARGRIDLGASRYTRRLQSMFGPEAAFTLDGRKAQGGLFDLTTHVRAENLILDSRGLADIGQKKTGPDGLPFTARIGSLKKIVSIPEMGTGLVKAVFRLEPGGFSVEGDADVADLSLLGYRLARAKGPALVRWSKGELTIKAQAVGSGGAGGGLLAPLGVAPAATFEGVRVKGGQFLIRSAKITAPNLVVTGEGQRGILGGLSFKGDARVASLAPIRAGAHGKLIARWSAGSSSGRPWDFTVDAKGEDFAVGLGELDRLLGPTPRLTGKGAWSNGTLSIANAKLNGAAVELRTSGQMPRGGGLDFKLDWTATGPFRAGPIEVAGTAKGDGAVTGALSAPKADLTADFDS